MNILNKFPRRNIVKEGLVLWLDGKDFTNNPNCTQLRDRSGNENHATPYGFAYTSESGKVNNGILFDGVDDYITISNSNTFAFEDKDFTIKTHININNFISSMLAIICKRKAYEDNVSFFIGIYSYSLRFSYSTNGIITTDFYFSYPFETNTDYYIALKRRGSDIMLYVNNVFISSQNIGTDYIYTTTESAVLGGLNNNIAKNFLMNATIYNVMIYNRALTETEIAQNYKALGGNYD